MPPKRLLLVEDDPPLREVVCEVLRGEGFEVVAARDAAEALALVRRGDAFDVIVLDQEAPWHAGRQVLSSLRAGGCRAPVVLVSGTLEPSREEAARLDLGPVVRKPLLFPGLTDSVRAAVGSGGRG